MSTELNNNEQYLADLMADNFTAANLETLCQNLTLDLDHLTGMTRQETAENITRTMSQDNRLLELEDAMYDIRPKLRPEAKMEESKGFELDDIDIEFSEEELNSRAGALKEGESADPVASRRIVNTGFVEQENANREPRDRDKYFPLYSDSDYYFWLEIGEMLAGSIEMRSVELETGNLAAGARFKVAIYGFDDGLEITEGEDIGELILKEDGSIGVSQPVAKPDGVSDEKLAKRLFFPLTTPDEEMTCRLRCNIYYRNVLLQSRMIAATIQEDPEPSKKAALRSVLDFVISKTLTHQLDQIPEHSVSMMVNDNGEGTHGFRFFGTDDGADFKNDSTFEAAQLQTDIDLVRKGLRKAAWGDDDAYDFSNPKHRYRYAHGQIKLDQLKVDLFRCAKRGYKVFSAMISGFAGDRSKKRALKRMMKKPGQVQIAYKKSANLVIPAGLIYDYPLDTGLVTSQLSLCQTFVDALTNKTPLETCSCFQGECAAANNDTLDVVCPGGFWGYRHMIGMPISIPNAPDPPMEIKIKGKRSIIMSVSTDPNFTERPDHEKAIKNLAPDLEYIYADERGETLQALEDSTSQVVYFFCHGILQKSLQEAQIQVGPRSSRGIAADNLEAWDIYWEETRPLVFINGCHTAALSPSLSRNMVNGFIDISGAAGVIGTEITNFTPIAVEFGEECLRRFITEGQTIGEAIRGARIKLLQQGNPLGLMYVPYVMTGLKLVE